MTNETKSTNTPFTHGISRRKLLSTLALGSTALGTGVMGTGVHHGERDHGTNYDTGVNYYG